MQLIIEGCTSRAFSVFCPVNCLGFCSTYYSPCVHSDQVWITEFEMFDFQDLILKASMSVGNLWSNLSQGIVK